jgi:hypothetical protein
MRKGEFFRKCEATSMMVCRDSRIWRFGPDRESCQAASAGIASAKSWKALLTRDHDQQCRAM